MDTAITLRASAESNFLLSKPPEVTRTPILPLLPLNWARELWDGRSGGGADLRPGPQCFLRGGVYP